MYDEARDLYKEVGVNHWDMSSGYEYMLGTEGMKICFVEGPELEALVLGEKSNITSQVAIELQDQAQQSVTLPSSHFTVTLWYSFRPVDFFADVNDTMSCDLLRFGDGNNNNLAISYSGGKEYNLTYKYKALVIDDNQERPNWEFDVNNTYTGMTEKRGWQWNHIAVVYNSGELSAYYNAYPVNASAKSVAEVVNANGMLQLNVPHNGMTPCGPVGFDEVSVWERALTKEELLALRVYVGRNRSQDELEMTTTAEPTTELPTTTPTESTAEDTTLGETTPGDTTAGESTAGPPPTTMRSSTGGGSTQTTMAMRPSSSRPESSSAAAGTTKGTTAATGRHSTQETVHTTKTSTPVVSSPSITTASLSAAEIRVQDEFNNIQHDNIGTSDVTQAVKNVESILIKETVITDGMVDKVLNVLEVSSAVSPATGSSTPQEIQDLQNYREAFVELYSTTINKIDGKDTTATDGQKFVDVLETFLGNYVNDPTVAGNDSLSSANVDVKVASIDGNEIQMGGNTSVAIPTGAFDGDMKVVVCIIDSGPMQDAIEPKGQQQPKYHDVKYQQQPSWNLSSPIVVLKAAGQTGSVKLNKPVSFVVPVDSSLGDTPLCVFQDEGNWSVQGLTLIQFDKGKAIVECETDHMTNFAVLMAVDGVPLEGPHAVALSVISYIGCGLSLFCLLIAIILFIILRELNSTRMGIVKNLCVALFLAQLLFVTALEPASANEIACKAVAAMLHYLFLCVIAWMFCNGIYLYQKVHSAARPGSIVDLIYFAILGWGAPAVVVAITAGVDHTVYGTPTLCWLSVEGSGIWAFVIPAMLIILFNAFVTFLTMKAFMSVKVFKDKTDKDKFKSGLRAIVVMLPILGLSWVFGLLAFGETGIFFQYLFAIFNSLQGVFLFIFHIFLNDEVKSAMRRRFGKVGASGDENTLFNKIWAFGGNNTNAEKTQMSSVTQTEMMSSTKPVYKN